MGADVPVLLIQQNFPQVDAIWEGLRYGGHEVELVDSGIFTPVIDHDDKEEPNGGQQDQWVRYAKVDSEANLHRFYVIWYYLVLSI